MQAAARVSREFFQQLAGSPLPLALFDNAPDIVFSIKDRQLRYMAMSLACVDRCGLASAQEAIGKTARDLFPRHMAERYEAQDQALFRHGRAIVDNLDLTLYPGGRSGWCITSKQPLFDHRGQIIGLACLSRDLIEPSRAGLIDAHFAATIDAVHADFARPWRIDELAEQAGLSNAQFERRMKKIFQLSALQYLMKLRIEQAARRLRDRDDAIAHIAHECGFVDQSALSRQFKAVTGLSPRAYRQMLRQGAVA